MYRIFFLLSLVLFFNFCNSKNKIEENTNRVDTTLNIPNVSPLNIVEANIDSFVNDSVMKNASISIYIYSIDDDSVFAQRFPKLSLVPASCLKLFTTAAALEILGEKRGFGTRLYYSGSIKNRVLEGDIIIKGGGDPRLGSGASKDSATFIRKWANAIKNRGIDSISGRVISNAQIFDTDATPESWIWGEIGQYYAAPAFGLSTYNNLFELKFNSKYKGSFKPSSANCKPYLPYITFENKIVHSKNETKNNVYFLISPYTNHILIKGSLPINKKFIKMKGVIPDPPYLLAYQLEKELKRKGVKIADTASTVRKLRQKNEKIPTPKVLLTSNSYSAIRSLIYQTNQYSNNLYAEHLIRHIGLVRYKNGSEFSGTRAVINFFKNKGIDMEGFAMFDGSGVSRYNSLTSKQLVDLLLYMKNNSSHYEIFYKSLAIAGKSGTFLNFFKNTAAEGKIRGKSGSLSRVLSYAGYINAKNGKEYAFAVVVNNYNTSFNVVKQMLEKMIIRILY